MQILEPAPATPAHLALPPILPLPPRLLAALAVDHSTGAPFDLLADPKPGERTSARVHLAPTHDIWLIRWGAGSGTAMHDHGGSAGAFYVVEGMLDELSPVRSGADRPAHRRVPAFTHRTMAAAHVHEVVNASGSPAASIHVYSPPLTTMNHYEAAAGSALRAVHHEIVDVDTVATRERAPGRAHG